MNTNSKNSGTAWFNADCAKSKRQNVEELLINKRRVYNNIKKKKKKEMFYLTTHSTHFIYGYMASDIWYRTTQIVREETRWRHMGYSFRLTARVLLYAPSYRQDSTYHNLCYTSRAKQEHNISSRRNIANCNFPAVISLMHFDVTNMLFSDCILPHSLDDTS